MEHTLSLFHNYPHPTGSPTNMFYCNLCGEKGCGPIYLCLQCDLGVHAACAGTAKHQTHFSHPQHPLHLHSCDARFRKCGSCGLPIHTWCFRCDICDFYIHSLCVKAPRFIIHHSHPHPLQIFESPVSGLHPCNACTKPVTDLFYECRTCHYRLHQFCATLSPQIFKHPKHPNPNHILEVQYQAHSSFVCSDCGEEKQGWQYHCVMCNYGLDAQCAAFFHELPHGNTEVSIDERSTPTTSSANSDISHNASDAFVGSNNSADAVVESFDLQTIDDSLSNSRAQENVDICATCLEGFDSGNPKRITSCGHHFHLTCMLKWMKKSTFCPLCRKDLSIAM